MHSYSFFFFLNSYSLGKCKGGGEGAMRLRKKGLDHKGGGGGSWLKMQEGMPKIGQEERSGVIVAKEIYGEGGGEVDANC